jgi:hypothetical protein
VSRVRAGGEGPACHDVQHLARRAIGQTRDPILSLVMCMELTFPPRLGQAGSDRSYGVDFGVTSFTALAVTGTGALCISLGEYRSGNPTRNVLRCRQTPPGTTCPTAAMGTRVTLCGHCRAEYYGSLVSPAAY